LARFCSVDVLNNYYTKITLAVCATMLNS